MKLLLTSAGIKNTSIQNALVDMLGKPIAESSALYIPTALHPLSAGPGMIWRQVSGTGPNPFCELGWKSMGVLELTALPSIKQKDWVDTVRNTDALLVAGGDPLYLCYWMRESGFADLLPTLRREAVYVGLSAGSMVLTPLIGHDFVNWTPPVDNPLEHRADATPAGGDKTLGIVDFSIFPHLDNEKLPENTMADAERWAAGLPVPAYAIDDQTAIQVIDGTIEVISEGHWKLFNS